MDIAPTLLELAGLRADPRSQCGLSLCASARARTAIRHGPAIFSRHRDFAAAQAVPRDVSEVYEEFGARDEHCKVLHHTGRRETIAYDLAADPNELSPIAPETPGAARLASVLADEMRRASVGVYDEGEFTQMRRQLAQLGYL